MLTWHFHTYTWSVLEDACTSFHPPREHRSTGALLIFFCSRIVLQKMYEVLLQRSTGSKEHFKIVTLLSALLSLTASHWSPAPGEGF